MTGRFDRLTPNRFTSEDKAVGVAVSAVLAGAVGLAVFNPLTGGRAIAETPAQAAAVAEKSTVQKGNAGNESSDAKALSAEAKAHRQGYKVPPHAVKPSEVIKLAEKQVGVHEDKHGETKYQDWYVSTPHAEETAARDGGFPVSEYKDAQWCNMFVSWLGAQVGVKNMGWDAYTVQHATWFKDTGRWGHKAKPGSVVFFDWQDGSDGSIGDIDHVGLVVEDNGDGTVDTIEGNTGNAVHEKTRQKSQIVGYGYPDYAS